MKKLLSITMLVCVLACQPACKSPERTAMVVTESAIETIDVLLAYYSDKLEAGEISVEQEDKVIEAYRKYRKGRIALELAWRAYFNAANSDKETAKGKLADALKAVSEMESELRTILEELL